MWLNCRYKEDTPWGIKQGSVAKGFEVLVYVCLRHNYLGIWLFMHILYEGTLVLWVVLLGFDY